MVMKVDVGEGVYCTSTAPSTPLAINSRSEYFFQYPKQSGNWVKKAS
jgi:hypothetical protein